MEGFKAAGPSLIFCISDLSPIFLIDRPRYILRVIRSDLCVNPHFQSYSYWACLFTKWQWFTTWSRFYRNNKVMSEMEDACLHCIFSCTTKLAYFLYVWCESELYVLPKVTDVKRQNKKSSEIRSEQSDLNRFAKKKTRFESYFEFTDL